ncbi:MAG: flagellar biosynthetic protein FliO [Rubrivivax sp.]
MLALGVVLVLIVLALWVVKFISRSAPLPGRGRNRRLSVVDQLQVDPRRQLLIIRRDDVEHLVLTGGPQDLVVETGIPVERPPLPTRRPEQEATAPPASPLSKPEIEKLRSFVRQPQGPRKPTSLRHTGLLRPVTQAEPAIIPMPPMAGDNSGRAKPDSATTPEGTDNGRIALGAHRTFGDGSTAGSR